MDLTLSGHSAVISEAKQQSLCGKLRVRRKGDEVLKRKEEENNNKRKEWA